MKKRNKYQKHLISIIRKNKVKEKIRSRVIKKRNVLIKHKRRIFHHYYKLKEKRERFYSSHYNKRYDGKPQIVKIPANFGIETKESIDSFLESSSEFIDFSSSNLQLDVEKCEYFWPSAVTLFCSLKEWVELSSRGKAPKIQSNSPSYFKTRSYLNYCGLYDYVNRPKDNVEDLYYKSSGIVKIKRERDFSLIDQREDEITELLRSHSNLTKNQLESFVDNVLIEIFNNVTEHGISHGNKGYWLIAQYHQTHKFISICIADNGIGIRNSIMTGPQAEIIGEKFKDVPENDGDFIKYAIEEVVSGALDAQVPSQSIFRKNYFESGANRGHGLKTIKRICTELSIEFAILSQHGYVFLDKDGSISIMGSKKNRVFAGTMYHLKIGTGG